MITANLPDQPTVSSANQSNRATN